MSSSEKCLLSQIRKQGRFTILPYEPQTPAEYRLLEMGLTPGTLISWERSSPLGDPVFIKFNGVGMSVRRKDFGSICVSPGVLSL